MQSFRGQSQRRPVQLRAKVKQSIQAVIAMGTTLTLLVVNGGSFLAMHRTRTWAQPLTQTNGIAPDPTTPVPVETLPPWSQDRINAQSTEDRPLAPPLSEETEEIIDQVLEDVEESEGNPTEGDLAPSSNPLSPIDLTPTPSADVAPSPQQRPPRTFGLTSPPPTGFDPALYNPQEPEQFNLYRLDVGDSVSVVVPSFPEFSFSATLDLEGTVPVPVLGRFSLLGLTLDEVEAKISDELFRRYLKEEPVVNATLVGARELQVTVRGEVVQPGFYSTSPLSSLQTLLAQAGGSTADADLRSILVRRQLRDGSTLERRFDLYTPLLTGQIPPTFRLQGGDTVIVDRLKVGDDQDYDRALIARSTLPQQSITVRLLLPTQVGQTLRNLNLPNGSSFIDVVAALPVENTLLVKSDVNIMRFDPESNGIVTQTVNAKDVIRGDFAQDIPLRDQDVIIVSRNLLGTVFTFLNQLTSPIRTILGFSNFFVRLGEGRFFGGGGNNNFGNNRGFF